MSTNATKTPTWKLISALGAIALASGLCISMADLLTTPAIKKNNQILTERAVAAVFPNSTTITPYVVSATGTLEQTEEAQSNGTQIFSAYDKDAHFLGVAITGTGQGYAGPIKVMFAYNPECKCITAQKVMHSTETPGFGDKLETDPVFITNFEHLDARLNEQGDALANPIHTVKHGTKKNAWEIDAISGATLSSNGMGRAANQAAQQAIPSIEKSLGQLKRKPQ